MVLFSLLIYCPLAHWTWHPDGFLHKWGVKDFAGGTVVHMSAGFAALAGAMVLGRRKSHVEQASRTCRPTSRSCCSGPACSGSAGSASTPARRWRPTARRRMAFATTNTASAAAMLGWMFFDWMRGQQALGPGRLHRRRRRPGGDHPGGRLRHGPREHRHRPGRQRHQQPGRAPEDASRRSTTRSTSSPATASAAWSA